MVYLLALLASCMNAAASVLQRAANRSPPGTDASGIRRLAGLLRRPLWFAGFAAMLISAVLVALALNSGPLSIVEPLLILELPVTIILAAAAFSGPITRGEWAGIAAITGGIAVLLFSLAPHGGDATAPPALWAAGLGAAAFVLAACAVGGAAAGAGSRLRPALLGVATGTGFGVTSALGKTMMQTLDSIGVTGLFGTWPVYAVAVVGGGTFVLLQITFASGPLTLTQPGMIGIDPIVAILWGTLIFDEQLRTGWWTAPAVLAAGLTAVGIRLLSRADPAGRGAAAEER